MQEDEKSDRSRSREEREGGKNWNKRRGYEEKMLVRKKSDSNARKNNDHNMIINRKKNIRGEKEEDTF
tara:strand:- start:4 stop:207 length:204 start_codon:yes stop_codon:yes gene_type:complete